MPELSDVDGVADMLGSLLCERGLEKYLASLVALPLSGMGVSEKMYVRLCMTGSKNAHVASDLTVVSLMNPDRSGWLDTLCQSIIDPPAVCEDQELLRAGGPEYVPGCLIAIFQTLLMYDKLATVCDLPDPECLANLVRHEAWRGILGDEALRAFSVPDHTQLGIKDWVRGSYVRINSEEVRKRRLRLATDALALLQTSLSPCTEALPERPGLSGLGDVMLSQLTYGWLGTFTPTQLLQRVKLGVAELDGTEPSGATKASTN